MIIVPTDTPGFELVGNISVMGAPRRRLGEPRRGQLPRAPACRSRTCSAPEGGGFVLAQHRLGPGRIHHCMRWIGICERAFDILCQPRRHPRAGARHACSARRQMVQQWIAESRAEIDAARLLVLHAAWKIEREGAPAAREEISLIKFTVARTLQRVLDRAIQALGAPRHDRRHAARLLVRARAGRRASTTAPTRCTSPAWRSASCTGTRRAGESGEPSRPRRASTRPTRSARRSASTRSASARTWPRRSRASRAPSPRASSARGTPTSPTWSGSATGRRCCAGLPSAPR